MQIGIVGAGASGMMAAIIAASNGAKVVLIDRMDRVGKKILATGNGRCNLTNMDTNVTRFHGSNAAFIKQVLEQFDVGAAMDFFDRLGIYCKIEGEGKVYPNSGQASSVLDVLRYEIDRLGIETICGTGVTELRKKKDGRFSITLSNGEKMTFTRVILATGGKASPNLGSNGSGYPLAKMMGHQMITPFPAIVQLNLAEPFLKGLKGVKFDGTVSVGYHDQVLRTEMGEILYTDYGISGPPVLQLSRMANAALQQGMHPWLKVDMFPQLTEKEVASLLRQRIALAEEKPLQINFIGLIHKRLIPILLKQSGITALEKPSCFLTEVELREIAGRLKHWTYEVIGTQGWNNAQATAGGIDTSEINPKTMESKMVSGLYFAGELVDVDGDCGGFNLQWAWSSGFVAGMNASL